MLQKIVIQNYKIFRSFTLEFNSDVNIIVGDNEAGKSTLLEAINLALTGRLMGRPLQGELSPHLFNQEAAKEYLQQVNAGENPMPPEIIIDLFFADASDTARLKGRNNKILEDAPGVRLRIAYNDEFAAEYKLFVDARKATSVPVEYYQVEWVGFSGSAITQRSIPVSASMINAARIRLQSGADYYLQNIIDGTLSDNQRVQLMRAYRDLKVAFSGNSSIAEINKALNLAQGDISDKSLSLSVDHSQQSGWESGLVPHLDELPFTFIGSGEQNMLKILLAISRRIEESHVVLIEEPENHLSFSNLNKLISKIEEKCDGRQIIITTHSSYVINKLGLGKLILLNAQRVAKLTDLASDTQDYFMKLSGYDTLRLVLAKKTIIVEGPSDELVVQRAYLDTHGCLPIQAGVDILNVRGLSSKRFLEIAAILGKTVHVVTDNDGDLEALNRKFQEFSGYQNIHVNTGPDEGLPSLEQNLLAVNGFDKTNKILGKSYTSEADLIKHMTTDGNKTSCAMAVFTTSESVVMPEYILDAIK
ncbi:ATP-dependent nuclease [Nocardia sp. NPDC003482]